MAKRSPLLLEFGVEVVPFKLPKGAQVVEHRFKLWLGWLRRNKHRVAGVVLSDARDVFVQADPWQDPTVRGGA